MEHRAESIEHILHEAEEGKIHLSEGQIHKWVIIYLAPSSSFLLDQGTERQASQRQRSIETRNQWQQEVLVIHPWRRRSPPSWYAFSSLWKERTWSQLLVKHIQDYWEEEQEQETTPWLKPCSPSSKELIGVRQTDTLTVIQYGWEWYALASNRTTRILL